MSDFILCSFSPLTNCWFSSFDRLLLKEPFTISISVNRCGTILVSDWEGFIERKKNSVKSTKKIVIF